MRSLKIKLFTVGVMHTPLNYFQQAIYTISKVKIVKPNWKKEAVDLFHAFLSHFTITSFCLLTCFAVALVSILFLDLSFKYHN